MSKLCKFCGGSGNVFTGSDLKRMREERGKTLAQVAKKMDIAVSTLWNMERYDVQIEDKTMNKFLKALK